MKKRNRLIFPARILALMFAIIIFTASSFAGCGNKRTKKTSESTTSEEISSDETSSDDTTSEDTTSAEDTDTTSGEDTSQGGQDSSAPASSQSNAATAATNATNAANTSKPSTTTTAKPTTPQQSEATTAKPVQQSASGVLTNIAAGNRVTVHDPSITYDPSSKKYYIFGSHMAWASSTDLMRWSMTTNNINNDYANIFKESGTWAALGSSNYNIKGNLWAPDVIYNKDMKKWCMYMSVNGEKNYSSIAMATADSITGPWTYAGTVVYSGFATAEQEAKTDFFKATGNRNIARYLKNGAWNGSYGTNAIDPCVKYDKNGNLWMAYGSWFGGIFILKLNKNTGLRDYDYKYSYERNASDEYLGRRISGGFSCTGEGAYITYDKESDYYYLYLSYGGLEATTTFSGYHMRLFRAKDITGPYLDAKGNNAICVQARDDQTNKGIKLMGNYYFGSLKIAVGGSNAQSGYKSPGHNSAIIDDAGNHYLVYHTRFNLGNEWHQVRVHQQFLNEDGWPVTAPYEYLGSKINNAGYEISEIVGEYEYINHGLSTDRNKPGMLPTLKVTLKKDGTISGGVTGTWQQVSKNGKGYYATMVINGITYKGVFFKQFDESTQHKDTMVFSLIGTDNQSIWGSKIIG